MKDTSYYTHAPPLVKPLPHFFEKLSVQPFRLPSRGGELPQVPVLQCNRDGAIAPSLSVSAYWFLSQR